MEVKMQQLIAENGVPLIEIEALDELEPGDQFTVVDRKGLPLFERVSFVGKLHNKVYIPDLLRAAGLLPQEDQDVQR
jgi:hypothetical protein